MERDFFGYLPSELTTNILSRLPLRSISISKCVCKPWLNLLQSYDFAKSKIKTPPALVQLMPAKNSTHCTVFEFKDEDEADVESHALRFRQITDFEIPLGYSDDKCRPQYTNGLLLVHSTSERRIYVCNPITREYIDLFIPAEYVSSYLLSFIFGVSKISGQYKIVSVNADDESDSHCVYTLGTGKWRRVEAGAAYGFVFCYHAYILCNGNLHWTVEDSAENFSICAFDLETECFSIFSAPPAIDGLTEDQHAIDFRFNVLRDCLCLSYTSDDKVVIWMMKEYRVVESWTMVYHISIDIDCGIDDCHWILMNVYPIKLFENGDVMMFLEEKCLIYYSNKTRTLRQVCRLTEGTSEDDEACAMIYTPSLFSLKSFGVENAISF